MKRYTFKIEDGSYHTRYLEGMSTRGLIEKLGKFEDIEAQLGIDLVTLFNALENGVFYYNEMYREIWFTTVVIRQKWQNKDLELVSASGYEKFNLTDYGKSWFLTSEEAEAKLKGEKE
jgi:hypothetical protein